MDRGWPSDPAPRAPSFSPPPSVRSGPEVDATVKWFNPEKGFGFVELGDGSGDAFVHIRAVEAAGQTSLDPGTRLTVRVGQGQKGPQVTDILTVDTSTAKPEAPRGGMGGGMGGGRRPGGPGSFSRPAYPSAPVDYEGGTEAHGTVKWYDPAKGFGFIAVDDGGKDVFLHRSALARAGLADLQEGQRVLVKVIQGRKGPEVGTVEVES